MNSIENSITPTEVVAENRGGRVRHAVDCLVNIVRPVKHAEASISPTCFEGELPIIQVPDGLAEDHLKSLDLSAFNPNPKPRRIRIVL